MLYNSKKIVETKENNPKVNNNLKPVTTTKSQKVLYWFIVIFSCILIIGIPFVIWWIIGTKNELNRMQLKINESASGIQIQLYSRLDILNKFGWLCKG